MTKVRIAAFAVLAAALASGGGWLRAQEKETAAAMKPGFDIRTLDRSVSACDDFYQFACGGWLKQAEIPADRSRWGRFSELGARNETTLHEILEEVSKDDPKRDPVNRQIGDCVRGVHGRGRHREAGARAPSSRSSTASRRSPAPTASRRSPASCTRSASTCSSASAPSRTSRCRARSSPSPTRAGWDCPTATTTSRTTRSRRRSATATSPTSRR